MDETYRSPAAWRSAELDASQADTVADQLDRIRHLRNVGQYCVATTPSPEGSRAQRYPGKTCSAALIHLDGMLE